MRWFNIKYICDPIECIERTIPLDMPIWKFLMLLDYASGNGYNIIHIAKRPIWILQYDVSVISSEFNTTSGGFALMVAEYLNGLSNWQVKYKAKTIIETESPDGEHDLFVHGDNVQIPFDEEIGTIFTKVGSLDELFMIIRIHDKHSFSYVFVFKHILR